MLVNKMHINMDKCCYMYYKPKSSCIETDDQNLEIKIGGIPIKQAYKTKFLGIVIDDKLSWNPQIN